jgi:hypothetical protein
MAETSRENTETIKKFNRSTTKSNGTNSTASNAAFKSVFLAVSLTEIFFK